VWLKGRAERQVVKERGKIEILQAQIEGQKIIAQQQASYNVEAQRQMEFSWKDEFLVLVFTYPFLLSFTAPFVDIWLPLEQRIMPHIDEAWSAVGLAPDWYQWALMGIIVATFGLKGWLWKQGKK